jgi:MSHA biogenesis protein MshI
MPAWLPSKPDPSAAWLAFAVRDDRIEVALVDQSLAARPAVRMCEAHATRGTQADVLKRLRGAAKTRRCRCTTLLGAGQYELQVVEAPSVPDTELKQAVRWKLKDLLDYPVDNATVDVLQVPPAPGGARAQFVHAVSARNDQVAARMRLFNDARVPLEVIDVPEMAQRNVARLFEEPNRGLAVLAFDQRGGMLTVTAGGELYMSRHTDISLGQLAGAGSEQVLERLVLEVQRSLDHFDRQFSYLTVARLLIAPVPVPGLQQYLAENLYLPVQVMDLGQALDLSAVPALRDPAYQSECLHLLGAALRQEAA